MKTLIRLLLTILLMGTFTDPLSAQTTHNWIGGSGNWSDTNHWDTGVVPSGSDYAMIIGSGTYTVTVDIDITISDLNIGGATGNQTLSLSGRIITINGTCSINDSGIVIMTNSTINGTGTITNSGNIEATTAIFNMDFDNAGIASFFGSANLNDTLITQPNSTLRLLSYSNVPCYSAIPMSPIILHLQVALPIMAYWNVLPIITMAGEFWILVTVRLSTLSKELSNF
jgi:hypothetical protein